MATGTGEALPGPVTCDVVTGEAGPITGLRREMGAVDDAHPSCPELLIEFPHLVAVSTLAAAGFCCDAGSVCRLGPPRRCPDGAASGGLDPHGALGQMGFVTDFVTHAGHHRGVPRLGVVGRRARRRLSFRAW